MGESSWHCLPKEIRILILEILLRDGCALANLATVSREWQTIIERHNFARINLDTSRLAYFDYFIRRNRALVRYIWLCLELQEYDWSTSAPEDPETWEINNADDILITTACKDLFSALSLWEPNGSLLLDISVHSPSDSDHWFKYLTFEPDTPSDDCDRIRCAEQSMLLKADDQGWIVGGRDPAPTQRAIYKIFDEILGEGVFEDEEEECQLWQQLSLVPAVTGVLLRQQNRRRWKPTTLAHMFARFPRLQEIHYEPWREWDDGQQRSTDQAFKALFESLASSQLRKLVLFENFDQEYPLSFMDSDLLRIPTPDVSWAVAKASLNLEHLSASFMVDASYFFNARESSWKWPNLISLALTSRLLAPDESPLEMDNMLRAAAAAVMKMPNLESLEIWNGREGLAMLFRYQPSSGGGPAVITCRGTWEIPLRPPVVKDWEAVALMHHCHGPIVVKELLDAGAVAKSHGDAIYHLKLSNSVIRPVSLQQIRMEQRFRKGLQKW